jgi:diguanylate cyclase (GGDEF)-like protein/putative nucleotidyltransferase with HDIG domain
MRTQCVQAREVSRYPGQVSKVGTLCELRDDSASLENSNQIAGPESSQCHFAGHQSRNRPEDEVTVLRRPQSRSAYLLKVVSVAGVIALIYSGFRLYVIPTRHDWMLLLILLLLLSSRIEVALPGVGSKLTLADTFIYVGILILNPWAAVVLGSIDGLATSFRNSKRLNTVFINMAAMNLAALGASLAGVWIFGPLDQLVYKTGRLHEFVLALVMLAAIIYFINTGIVGAGLAVRRSQPFLKVWRENYLWTSAAFLISMAAAGIIAKAITAFGFYSLFISAPILSAIYATYRTYFTKVEASNKHIELLTKLHLATIESLTMAIDAKDPIARGHIQRVRTLAEGLARAAGYPEDQMEGLKAAALLHDIGKLAVPEYILSKPGKLTAAEYSKVMIHPVVGADILSNVEFPYEVVPIVKHHHEKWDGTGYPAGLKGEEIPRGARILTIVDCYDALTTTRPYRPSYSRAQALELMSQESARMFDPSLLNVFLEIVGEMANNMPAPMAARSISLLGLESAQADRVLERNFGLGAKTRTEKALRDISSAQLEVLSLYEISQTLGSTLKLSEVLPIIATKLENIANFTTLVIYLAEGERLRTAYVIGKNADILKNTEMRLGEGGAGWVAQHRQVLIGGSPLADLERSLGERATLYRSTAIFPLVRDDSLMGTIALYSEEERGYSSDEVRLLETISSHAAAAVNNALAFERTKESALTDDLTGLPNSRYMYSFFDQERSRADRHGYPLVLMMMDLDGFKKINDTYGHHIGDDILRHIAEIARTQLRSGDTLIRYAGDEFVAVLHRATTDIVLELKARLQSTVDCLSHEVRPGRVARVGISIGHATYGEDGLAIDELMEVADQRMYDDKTIRKRSTSGPRVAVFPTRASSQT